MTNIDHPRPAADPGFSSQVVDARRFFCGTDGQSPGAWVVGGGMERVQPDYLVERRNFPWAALEWVVEGAGRVRLGETNFDLLPGVMFTYGPGVPHRIETDPDRPLLKYFVDFRPGAAPQGVAIPSGAAWSSAGLATVAVEGIRKLLDELIRLGAASATPTKVLDHMLSAVLVLCQPVSFSADGGGAEQSVAFATYRRCRQVIDQRALELRSLEQAATACGVDAAYLCRMFRRFDTLTPYQRLLQVRMNHAAARLRSGPVLVKEVAAELGYSDPFHFSRVFRRVVGMPPGRFRS